MNLQDFEVDSNGFTLQFNGNTNLKSINQPIPYTKEHLEEYIKCKNDYRYFTENYYHIISVDDGIVKPKLRDYQIEMIDSFVNDKQTIIMASRQSGKSTSFEIYINWLILFNKDKNVAILANKLEQSCEILLRIKSAYELFPMWLKQGVKTWNVKSIALENGSRVVASATNSSSIRGKAVTNLFCDEAAHIKDWDNFISSVFPTISSGKNTQVVYVSTPYGMNHFYKDWNDSINGLNSFKPIRVGWERVPGRDEEWRDKMIANIGVTRYNQEFNLSFLGSISTLIEPEIISHLKHKSPIIESVFYNKIPQRLHHYCKIYYEPIKGHSYVIGVDSAKMTEDNAGDALGMQVLDITSFPIKQVATFFISSGISYLQSPDIIVNLAKYYNNSLVFIENNEIGQEVANMVHFDYEYDNVYWEKTSLPGFRTTKKTKRLGCTNLKLLIEKDKIEINDFDTISQLSTFIRKKDSYCAESGYQDDLVMSLISALFFLQVNGLDIDIIESTNDLAKKLLDKTEFIVNEEDEEVMFGILPDDEYEQKPKNDFDWLV